MNTVIIRVAIKLDLNAIAHRDYFSQANVQINIFHDRVVIDNPGGLADDVKIADLYRKSIPRNDLLFGLMQRMDLVEKIGSGLMRMNEMMDEYLLPHPTIDASAAYFGITFERPDLQKMSIEQRLNKYHEGGEKVLLWDMYIIQVTKRVNQVSIDIIFFYVII